MNINDNNLRYTRWRNQQDAEDLWRPFHTPAKVSFVCPATAHKKTATSVQTPTIEEESWWTIVRDRGFTTWTLLMTFSCFRPPPSIWPPTPDEGTWAHRHGNPAGTEMLLQPVGVGAESWPWQNLRHWLEESSRYPPVQRHTCSHPALGTRGMTLEGQPGNRRIF